MGLLLSVLVVCVGVLEVLACVRHFQDGYLPLWTPHCAVTSGYTASYERWRKKPSGSFQFSSFDDASGPLNLIEDQSSENCLDTSRSTQNGITGKQIDDAKENSNPSADYCCHQSKSDSGNGLSPFIDDNKREVDYHNTSDFLASPLVSDEGDLKKIHNNISNVLPSNERVSAISYSEHKTSQETSAPEFTCDLIREERAVNSSSHGGVLKSHAQSETSAPPFTSALDFKSEDQFSHVIGIEKYPISTREIEIQNEVPILSTGVKLQSPPSALITEQSFESDSHAGILSGKHPTQDDCISRTEAGLKIPSSNLYTEKSSDTVRDVSFNGVGRHDQVSSFEDEPNIPVSKSVAEESSIAVKELYQVPNTEIQHETSPSDFEVEEPSITVGEFEGQIPTSIAETNIPSSDLKIQDDKSILGCAAGRASSECGEIFYKQLDTTVPSIENESAVPSSVLNPELRFQNSLISSLASAETSITPVEASTENAVKILNDQRISNISDSVPFSPSELVDAQKGYPGSNTYIETETCLPEENTGQHLRTDTRNETEALNSQVEAPSSTYDTKNTTKIEEGLEVSQRPITEKHLDLQEDSTGSQHDSLGPRIEPHTFSPNLQSESQIITNEYTKQNVSESCLDPQTTLTDLVTSRNGGTPHDDRGFHDTSYLAQPDVRNEIPDLQTTSFTSVTPLTIDTSFESPISGSPLTFDTSFETAGSVTPLPTDHQPSVSPPKLPSTPKKSKADISWPTFFPGTPVIKRPSVSFATPEAIFADEYQELLRQHVEEVFTHPPVKDSDDISTRTEPETTTSTSEEKSSEEKSVGTPERSESFEENPDPIIYREKSPSNIVSGNDFSKKELKLQRRRSYKQKRYNSATEISTRDEQAEDRSFSENNPGVTRASSLREPKKRHKITPKASSFEDIILRDIKTEDAHLTNTAEESADVSIPEDRETEREEPQKEQPEVVEGTQEISDVTDCPRIPAERNEPKLGESKPQGEEKAIGKREDAEGSKEEEVGGDDEYSFSEDQSSSQQKSPPTEAFWLIFSGEYTKAMSKDWHSGHFCCWQCDESLTGQRYVLRDDHPYCIKCYESVFANVCEECNKTIGIDSKDLSYKDKHWHEACFLCNKCRVSLVDKQFGSKADKIYCGNCYDAQFASRCDGCGEIFRAGTKKMEYKTRQWHEKCFCCCVCKSAIGTKSFIPREQEIYCATCYEEKFATRCVKCNKIITSGGVTYKNEPWHRECFTCTHCNTSLAGQRFTSRDEKPYCADCFGELFAKRCTACSKPITGIGGTRFISFEDRHWHNDCFICATCKTSLVGRGFITDADDIICPECAKQKLM